MDVEKIIFDMYKDEPLISKKFKTDIMKKFNVTPVMASDIFVKIQNYQINKFGRKLDDFYEAPTREEMRIIHRKARQRTYMRKKTGSDKNKRRK